MSRSVYLALGTNLGDRMVNLTQALVLLAPIATLRRWSRVYETEPWGYLEQPPFLNMVVEAETDFEPLDLLDHLKFLEEKIGREKSFRYGPRLIDLDILIYDDLTLHSSRLEIPHPRIPERAFVLVPLAELVPDRRLPAGTQTIAEMLDQVDREGIQPVTGENENPPAEIALMFQTRPGTLELFTRLPASHQREYLKHIIEAKKPATRRNRFDWMAGQLLNPKD